MSSSLLSSSTHPVPPKASRGGAVRWRAAAYSAFIGWWRRGPPSWRPDPPSVAGAKSRGAGVGVVRRWREDE